MGLRIVTLLSETIGKIMHGQQGDLYLPLSRAEAQELLARLLLSHDDDNDLSASLMKRLAQALEPERAAGFRLEPTL